MNCDIHYDMTIIYLGENWYMKYTLYCFLALKKLLFKTLL